MPSCVFRKCKNYDKKIKKNEGISYHRFPTDEVSLQNWITVVRRQRCENDWMPSSYSRICSNHFKNEDKYTSRKGLTLLKKNAVPILQGHKEDEHHTPSTSSLDNVPIPEAEEIFDIPRKSALRKTVRKLKLDKCVLKEKNKLLCQQNKRLKKKIAKTTTILKILKNRNYMSDEQFTELNLKAEIMDLFNRIYCKKTRI